MGVIGIIVPILLLITSYLLGSIPSALIIGKVFKGIDIREYGSKNMGTTNTLRVLGLRWALIVFILDALKAAVVVSLFSSGLLDYQADWMIIEIHPVIYGLVAVVGHAFPIFADFKGGKGIACSAGIAMVYCPLIFVIAISVFFIVLLISKYVSLSSILGIFTAFICSFFKPKAHHTFSELFTGTAALGVIDWIFVACVFVLLIFIIIMHRKNIVKIFKKQENKTDLIEILKRKLKKKKSN